MCEVLGYCGMVSAILYLAMHSLKTVLAIVFFRARQEKRKPIRSLAVLTPIVSGDPNLEDFLRGHLATLPLDSQIFWIVNADDEEAKRITSTIAKESPHSITTVSCPEIPRDINRKAYKMQLAFPLIATEYVCVLDDDTVPNQDTLEAAMGALETADIYTGLPCYMRGANFWSDMICHFVANNGISTYLATQCFGPPVSLNGMFYVMKTTTLHRYGGFTPILPFLCDDYALARVVKEHGGLIHQSVLPHSTRTHAATSREYIRLFHRWFVMAMVLFRDQPLRLKCMILVLLGFPPVLLWFSLLSPLAGLWGWLLLLALVLFRHLLIRIQHWTILPFRYPVNFFTSMISEFFQPFHVLHACSSNTFYWRKRLIRIDANGTLTNVADSK